MYVYTNDHIYCSIVDFIKISNDYFSDIVFKTHLEIIDMILFDMCFTYVVLAVI